MPTPKSQTKVLVKDGKTEVTYERNFDAAEYYIFELARAALRDVGKFVTKAFRTAYYQHFQKHTGDAGKATKYKVWSGKSTTSPRVQIGLKTGQNDGFYAYFQEFGTSTGIPRLGLLSNTVHDNIPELYSMKIESNSGDSIYYLDDLK